MNKKFKELAIRAQEQVRDGLKDPSRLQNWFMDELVQEKFGELLVKECARYMDNHPAISGKYGHELKEHFGME